MPKASALVPLWDRADEWARRLAMIRQARVFLYLSTYYIEHDRYGTELLGALAEAQARGVAINLLIDGFGQQLGGVLMTAEEKAALGEKLAALERGGAVVTTYRPRRRVSRWLGGGHHVKIQVSEGGEAIFGSSNITNSSFEHWNEYSVALRGSIVRTLLESYREIGGRVEDAHLERLDSGAGDGDSAIELDYWLCNPNERQGLSGPLGWSGTNVVTDRLVEMIDSARLTIAMTSFYFKPVEAIVAAMVRAAGRGVQVEVHHSHREALPATELAWIAAAAHYRRLLGAGVRIYENRHGEHSKIVLVDGERVAFGSYNFEHAAHDRLAEAMLVSRDVRALEPAAAIFRELREHPDNVLVTVQTLAELPVRLRVKRKLLAPFKRWM